MNRSARLSLLACTLCAALLLLASRAVAQSTSLGSGGDPYGRAVYTVPSPYWGYTYTPYYSVQVTVDPARVILAQGDFLVKQQEAAQLREKVRRDRLETRKAELEHWEWERDFRAGILNREDERQRQAQVECNRKFPPQAEIFTGQVLNSLLNELKVKDTLSPAESTPVSAEWLAHVHLSVNGRSNLGLLKDDQVFWPQLLLQPEFADERENLGKLLARAREQAQAGPGRDSHLVLELRQKLRRCEARLDEGLRQNPNDPEWNPRNYVEARLYFRQVDGTIKALEENPDAAFLLKPPQGKTVAELVASMKHDGTSFAPATTGCERAYLALHRALADEVTKVQGGGK